MNRLRARSLLRGATSRRCETRLARRCETRQAKDWKNHVETCACKIRCLKQLESTDILLQLAFNCLDFHEGKHKFRKPHVRAKWRH